VFESSLNGQITLTLDVGEREVLGQLFDQVEQLLDELTSQDTSDPLELMLGMNGSTQISQDPALARLFPDGYSEDEHASDLQAQSWLKALNDLRLVLGTRLEISDDNDFDFDSDEPGIHLYNYLTYLQGTLIDALN